MGFALDIQYPSIFRNQVTHQLQAKTGSMFTFRS